MDTQISLTAAGNLSGSYAWSAGTVWRSDSQTGTYHVYTGGDITYTWSNAGSSSPELKVVFGTDGYYIIHVNATDILSGSTYTATGYIGGSAPTGAGADARSVTAADAGVGNAPSPSSPVDVSGSGFQVSVSPDDLSIPQGTGTTATVTVTPENNFTGTVTLGAQNLPAGFAVCFYDPLNPPANYGPGGSTISVSFVGTGSQAPRKITLTVETTAQAAVTTLVPDMLTISATSGTQTETAPVAVNVSGAPPSPPSAFQGGLGRRGFASGCVGISGTATLPVVSVVLEGGHADAACVYVGTEGVLDVGVTQGHTGGVWGFFSTPDLSTSWFNANGTHTHKPNPAIGGTVGFSLELPGYVRSADDLAANMEDPNTNQLKAQWIAITINGTEYYLNDPSYGSTSGHSVQRMNTIAQNDPSGFYSTGTSAMGAAWSNLAEYYLSDGAVGQALMGTSNSSVLSEPGPPYVECSDSNPYWNETINMSTVPLSP